MNPAPLRARRPRTSLSALALAAVVALLATLAPAPAGAAITNQVLTGTAGVTQVKGVDGLVESGMTSASFLSTPDTGQTASNALADVDVAGLVHATAVSTKISTTSVTGGKKIDSTAHLANLSLLGGRIVVNAVDTTSTVSIVDGIATPSGGTRLAGISIAGTTLPIDIGKNFTVDLPGIARVTLNYSQGANTSDATAVQSNAGILVTLLSAIGTHPAGTTILVTPTQASAGLPNTPLGVGIGGSGYTTQVSANVLGLVNVISGPTARATMPPGGTAGKDVTNNTVGVNVPQVLTTGLLSNTVNGSVAPTASRSTVTSKVAAVNVLNGLIRADAVVSKAEAYKAAGQPIELRPSATLVNLVIAGQAIPVTVAPNTTLNVAGLGQVVLNQQVRTATGLTVRALVVKVGTAGLGLPLGTTVELGVANAWVGSQG